jgi:ATP adenylyltransferase
MAEYDGLGFYNAGEVASASQPHKHLQLVPLPLSHHGPAVPMQPLLDARRVESTVGRSPALPFLHARARLDPSVFGVPGRAAEEALRLYRTLMDSVGIDPDSTSTEPYNLLVTRHWMLIVPRQRESFESMSLNALAFAGALLVRDQHQLNRLKQAGPMAALRYVTFPSREE